VKVKLRSADLGYFFLGHSFRLHWIFVLRLCHRKNDVNSSPLFGWIGDLLERGHSLTYGIRRPAGSPKSEREWV
jgi:hypothetical protein